MKRILIICLIMASYICVSQDRFDPSPILDDLNANQMFNFEPNRFIKAWNWSSETRKLDSALGVYFNHTSHIPVWNNTFPHWFTQGQNFIFAVDEVAGGDRMRSLTQAQSIHYEPSLTVDTTDYFTPMLNDTCGSVFGFKTKNSAFVNAQNIAHHFVLRDSVLQSLQLDSVIVLENALPNNQLFDITEMTGNNVSDTMFSFNGHLWFVNIRLHSLDAINLSNQNDTILKIRLPYKTMGWVYNVLTDLWEKEYSTGHIVFDSLPSRQIGNAGIDSIFNNRANPEFIGLTRHFRGESTDNFYITADMLRTLAPTDSNNTYFTLSASFRADDPIENNPSFQNVEGGGVVQSNIGRIIEISPEVTYFGNVNVSIDWIQISTPKFRDLVFGQLDNDIILAYRRALDSLRFYRPDIRIFRFCGIDVSQLNPGVYFVSVGGRMFKFVLI